MKKAILAITAIFLIAIIPRLVSMSKQNRSQPLKPIVALASSADKTQKVVSASVKLVPTIGTNIASPGQFGQH